MHRRSFIAALPFVLPAAAALAHPNQAPTGAEAQRMIDEVTAFRARLAKAVEPLIEAAPATELSFRVFTGPTVIVTGKSPILNVKEGKTNDFRWVAVYVTAVGGWQLAVSRATRLP